MDLAQFKTRLEHWLGALAKSVIQGTALSLKAFVASATGSAVTGGAIPSLDLKQAAAVAGTAAVINLIDFLSKNPVPDADDDPPPAGPVAPANPS